MLFGVREICEVVLKAKSKMTLGSKTFFKDEPVLYFDTLKTSGVEGQSTTVYAQGGRGNARLVAWDGERVVTFTMEDALISAEGLSILAGAGLLDGSASGNGHNNVHMTKQMKIDTTDGTGNYDADTKTLTLGDGIQVAASTDNKDYAYVMILDDNGNIDTEPIIAKVGDDTNTLILASSPRGTGDSGYTGMSDDVSDKLVNGAIILVDFYAIKTGVKYIEITPEIKSMNFYLEAETLFRTQDGRDLPAEFIIPNCKVQSNFNFSMASSGDPSTFTFTMDAFPDYTRFDGTKKVIAAIQIIEEADNGGDGFRSKTNEPKS